MSKSREEGQSAKQDTTGRGLEGNENDSCKYINLTRKIRCSAARGSGVSPRVGCLLGNGVCWKMPRMEGPTPRLPGCAGRAKDLGSCQCTPLSGNLLGRFLKALGSS